MQTLAENHNTFLLVLLSACCLYLSACDHIQVLNAQGDTGILIDGERTAPINDEGFVGSGNGSLDFEVGYIELATAPGDNNWVIGFGAGLAPTYLNTPWTTSEDRFDMTMAEPIDISLTIWIMQGPYMDQLLHAADAIAMTDAIWQAERAGFRIATVVFNDATADPDSTFWMLNSISLTRNWNDYSTLIGSDSGRINIYWINTVGLSQTTGLSDFGSRILMGKNTGDELLAHEIGHAFNLQHPSPCRTPNVNFDATNVMWPCSNTRAFLSEGQIFRAHFDAASATNNVYAARPATQPTTNCPSLVGNNVCPILERRLWADGAFPAN